MPRRQKEKKPGICSLHKMFQKYVRTINFAALTRCQQTTVFISYVSWNNKHLKSGFNLVACLYQCIEEPLKLLPHIDMPFKIQSTLVISKSKGPSETLRDIHTWTYQICRIEENTNWTTKFRKWTCNLTPLVRNTCWKYCGKGVKLLLRSNFSSYSQYFLTWC